MTVSPEEVALLARLQDRVTEGLWEAMAGVPESDDAKMAIVSCLLAMAVVWARRCGVDLAGARELLGVAWASADEAMRRRSPS